VRDRRAAVLAIEVGSFSTEARGWTRETCRSLGIAITAPIEQVHVRPWSRVFRVPTNSGAVYLKCCGPTQAHEPRLTALLHREFPGLVTEVLALHPTQPWMLVAEGGKKLRDAYSGDDLLRSWREVLPRYAQLQRAATPHVGEILGFGTPDHRAAPMVAAFTDAVANEPALSGERPDRLTDDERRALIGLRPKLNDSLGALAALGIEDTLQHDDLHHGNVLVRDGRAVIFDWGDACVSHPFLTLAVTLRFAADATKHAPGDAPIVALRDAYLEPWSERALTRELRDAAELGRRIGEVSRTLTFYAVARAYPGVVETYPGGFAGSLRRVIRQFG
jgi:Phosphotransferase enzyme family